MNHEGKIEIIQTKLELILPPPLVILILNYLSSIYYKELPHFTWTLPQEGEPSGIGSPPDSKILYVCDQKNHALLAFSENDALSISKSWSFPQAIEFCLLKKRMYLLCHQGFYVYAFDSGHLVKEISNWCYWAGDAKHMKVDHKRELVHFTVERKDHIYTYDLRTGNFLQKWVQKWDAFLRLKEPKGLTLDETLFYICDWGNDQIQVTNQTTLQNKWGKRGIREGEFKGPFSIFLDVDILYIGDWLSVSLFTCEGVFIQKLGATTMGSEPGQFRYADGLCTMDGILYVSDRPNHRIQAFKRII